MDVNFTLRLREDLQYLHVKASTVDVRRKLLKYLPTRKLNRNIDTSMIQEFLLSGSIGVTCLVALVTGLVVYWLIQKWKYNFPPGPSGLPVLGNALQMDSKKLHEQALEWSKKYGPVITVRLVDVFTYGGKDIVFGNYGPTWKIHRRLASKALRYYMQGDALEHRIHEAVKTAFDEIDTISGQFDPVEYINFIVVNIITGLCYGGKYEFKDKEVQYILETGDEFTEKLGAGTWEDIFPPLRHVYKTALFKDVEAITDQLMERFIRKKFKEAESTFSKENIRHFTDNLILARMEAEEEDGGEAAKGLDEDHLVQTLGDIFFAGIDTSRFTLRFALLHMVAFPDIQEKVQEEIDNAVGRDRLPGVGDRPNLGYTEAVLHESMRLSSVVPTGIAHVASRDTEVSGYRIPKGTNVVINHWGLHHDPNAWDDVDRFIPERYLDENGKLGPKPKSWLPFSAGTRVCLGEFVAKPELHLIFASLMQRYKWKMESGLCPDITPVGNTFQLATKPYKVIAEKRV
ncbi:steroid 17-alpha-hydroxylase/17,20 lyase-like isoform X2 [Mercenaria mercenaria]|uniref:steroid 17-alpha-hydroxylase/17,20 lyase-like isoform X2 n=1 Tax=Mercenaria mercenaria TaxID=6596 RepID=UPI00234E7CBD|nr:steroid 17-alpha-hydroxylase/17,20 lyase-like isoform X2 [Mercenaria mercenaria]